MEKYDFIKLMLQNRNLSVNDKKRLLLLATREIGQEDNTASKKKESRKVEMSEFKDKTAGFNPVMNSPENNDIENSEHEQDNYIEKERKHRTGVSVVYVPPKNIQKFLRAFNQDDILRYTCHLIDSDEAIDTICKECNSEEYDFFEHVKLIKKHFRNLTWKFKEDKIQLSPNMITLISVYLTGGDLNDKRTDNKGQKLSWSGNKIETSWACDEIIQWAKLNPKIIPNPGPNIERKQNNNTGYILPKRFKSRITGATIKSFSELVIFFKSQFHIRQDNSLQSIIEVVNLQWKPEDIQVTFLENYFNNRVELFTDVDKLVQAYKKIIDLCIECRTNMHEPILVELSFYDERESNYTYFCIHHVNSIYKKTSKNSTEKIGEKHGEMIKYQINGLCDFFIEAKFGDERCGIINLWDKNEEFIFKPKTGDIKGVKYILRF